MARLKAGCSGCAYHDLLAPNGHPMSSSSSLSQKNRSCDVLWPHAGRLLQQTKSHLKLHHLISPQYHAEVSPIWIINGARNTSQRQVRRI